MTAVVPADPVAVGAHDARDVRVARSMAARSRTPLLLVAVGVLLCGWHSVSGVGYVLDDWFAVGHATFDGAWSAAGPDQWRARPGAGVTYGIVFGLLRDHPGVAVALLGALTTATAVAFWSLLRRFAPERLATVAAVLWIVQPNHVSLEVWISAVNISVSLLLVVVGARVMLTPRSATGPSPRCCSWRRHCPTRPCSRCSPWPRSCFRGSTDGGPTSG